MIRAKYLLSQEQCCGVPGQFAVHQLPESPHSQGQQRSEYSELVFSPQQYVGEFQQSSVSRVCCCSFKPIRSLEMQMYGQRLSKATSQTTCCLNLCSGQLVVSTTNNVLIGVIKKVGSSWCAQPFLVVENEEGKQVLFINVECCQMANICPRMLKCRSQLVYSVRDGEGKEVGKIINLFRSLMNNIFWLRDDFEVIFTGVEKEKEKILLLNAVVFINQLKHQLF